MEADFSGWATKAGLKCSDGRTILPGAFKHQDSMQVPLVWQHGHTDPENVLGHVRLENRDDEGVYAYGFFNKTAKAKHTAQALEHKDINAMSIWANQIVEQGKLVMHGLIREVSLVLSGANPGALIENVTIRHSDGDEEVLPDSLIIMTGLELEHSDDEVTHATGDDETVEDVYNSLSEKQKQVVHFMIGEALSSAGATVEQSDLGDVDLEDADSIQAAYDSMSDPQKQVLHFMVSEALDFDAEKGNTGDNNDGKGNEMKHNVFEDAKGGKEEDAYVLSHDDLKTITADATKSGSLKDAVEQFAIAHGIQDIDVLFPEARNIQSAPELFARRTAWVTKLLSGVRKSPFSRIRTMSADITVAEARAKGYIKGDLKKEEFFKVKARITTPQTIYKKQKLDRDDILDITDFDVVAWLKGEMRIMLDEELARAILVGDGRPVDSEDKINEDHIRPVANDHELYTTTLYVNLGPDDDIDMQKFIDSFTLNRSDLRGSGSPVMFTTEKYIARFLLMKDGVQRRIYKSLEDIANELRVGSVEPVDVLDEYEDIIAVIFSPNDYVVGADNGGNVGMFEDFDIDYNQHKYLIETRASGALDKLKSAIVVRRVTSDADLVVPAAPVFEDNAITITDQTGVVYRNADTDVVMNAAGSPYAVAEGDLVTVVATPSSSAYYFASSDDDEWTFEGVEV